MLIRELGYPKYRQADQQVTAEVVERVRRHAGRLGQPGRVDAPTGGRPLPTVEPGPVRKLDARVPTDPETAALLDREMAGVKRIGRAVEKPARPVPAKVRSPGSVGVSAVFSAPDAPRVVASRPSPAVEPSVPVDPELPPVPSPLTVLPAAASEERSALLAALGEAELARRRLVERVAELERELEAVRVRPIETDAGAPPSLRHAFEARGLRGDDEIGFALEAVARARRAGEFADRAVQGPGLDRWLAERLLLVAAEEEVPPGMVGVLVPSARSEGASAPGLRSAVKRMETALLVNGRRRLTIVGGPAWALRVLRETLDRRVEIRSAVEVSPGETGFVVTWAVGRTGPGTVGASDLAGFCRAVADLVDG